MKQFVIEFEDEDIDILEEQLEQYRQTVPIESIEDYIYYSTMMHCKTLQAASQLIGQGNGLEDLLTQDNVHVGVLNMPVSLSADEDKEEFTQYLNQVLNDAVKEYNDRNKGQLN